MNRKERRAAAKTGQLPVGFSPTFAVSGEKTRIDGLRAAALQHYQTGRFREAGHICSQILALDSANVAALHITGLLALQAGRNDVAINILGTAIRLNDRIADLYTAIAEALQRIGQFEQAIFNYRQALALDPADPEIHYNCGNVFLKLERFKDAVNSYDRALAIRPDLPRALNNRAHALTNLGQINEALASYDQAVNISPNFVEALYNRGALLMRLKRFDEALTSFSSALTVEPNNAAVLNARGNLWSELERYDKAAKDFECLLAVDPNHDYAKGALLASRLRYCDWTDYQVSVEEIEKNVADDQRVAVPFLSLCTSTSPKIQLRCAEIFGKTWFEQPREMLWKGECYQHERIRVAYLSAHFHVHATSLLMAGLFELHDKSRFETVAISYGPDSRDQLRERLLGSFDHFIDVRHLRDEEVAGVLRDLEIDIAVDLMGYTLDSRPGILAYRPAPLQVSYLGYPGTMGSNYIDYIIADGTVIPESEERFYSERIVYMPDSYQVNDYKRSISDHTPGRLAAGLPSTGFVFCSFNQHYKIAPPMFDIWMTLLRQTEGSVLWLLDGLPPTVRNLRQEAEKRGVAAERLIFAPRVRPEEHLARHRLADLSLDTLPYNAHTTASDALWAGLPLVTCCGTSFAGRVAASLLKAVGLPELITKNLKDYEDLALKLATDGNQLATIKAKLAKNRTVAPLFDSHRFCRCIENAYATMWGRQQRRAPPASFAVSL